MNTYPDPMPIKDAPLDGTPLLVFFPNDWGWLQAWYAHGRWTAEGSDRDMPAPTHFMPLPPNP